MRTARTTQCNDVRFVDELNSEIWALRSLLAVSTSIFYKCGLQVEVVKLDNKVHNDRVSTTATESRKSSKPIMEKRRRARINASLAELKSLLLEAIKKEGARHNKMEKADILEMAVKHLRQIQRQQFAGEPPNDPSLINKYRLGFHACAQEVSKYLGSNSDEDVELKTKLLNHLANCMTSGQFETLSTAAASSSSFLSSPSSSSTMPIPLSPLSLGSLSPASTTLSPDTQNSMRTGNGSVQSSSLMIKNELPGVKTTTSELKPDNQNVPKVSESETNSHSPSDRMIRATLASAAIFTSPTPASASLLMKPMTILSSSGAFLQSSPTPGDRQGNDDDDNHRNNFNGNDRRHTALVTEVNNNTITLPTFINVGGSTTLASLQHQQQHSSHLQQQAQLQQPHLAHHHLNQPDQPQQQYENASLIANLNRLQLIPTKAVNGETIYVLSANLVNPAQFPNYTIPVLTPPIVNHAQVLAPPLPQQAIQIAVSYPQDERQQPLAFLQHIAQPQLQSSAHKAEQHLAPSHSTVSQQATPLNLSSSSHQSSQLIHPLITNHPVSFSSPTTLGPDSVPVSSIHGVTTSLAIPVSAPSYSTLDHTSCVTGPAHTSSENTGSISQPYTSVALPSANVRLLAEFPANAQSTSSVAIVKPHFNDSDRSCDDLRQKSRPPVQEDTKEGSMGSLHHMAGEYLSPGRDKSKKQSSFFRPW